MTSNQTAQHQICERWGASYLRTDSFQKLGMADNVQSDIYPIHGLRHLPCGDTSGWYIWAGEEISEDENFFKPLHVGHLSKLRPEVEKYLGLAPGWRFLVAPGYEDVWFDKSLLES